MRTQIPASLANVPAAHLPAALAAHFARNGVSRGYRGRPHTPEAAVADALGSLKGVQAVVREVIQKVQARKAGATADPDPLQARAAKLAEWLPKNAAYQAHPTQWIYDRIGAGPNPYRAELISRRDAIHRAKAQAILDGGLDSAARAVLRNASGRWAGGDTVVQCSIGSPSATGDSRRAWSDNGKWSGLNAYYSLAVPADWSSRVGSIPGLPTAGGLLTLDAQPREPINGCPAWDATWARNGRGFDVVVERGVIALDGTRWLHGKTETAIRRLLAPPTPRKPADPAKTQAARWTRWERQHGAVLVTVDQHERAGNCREGTLQWAARHFDGRTSATVGELVTWLRADGTDQVDRVENAIRAAIR